MEIRVNKGVSHPIEIISCGTSSCITIEEAEKAYDAYRNNEAYRSLEKKVNDISAQIERHKRDIQKYADEIARLTKEKEIRL